MTTHHYTRKGRKIIAVCGQRADGHEHMTHDAPLLREHAQSGAQVCDVCLGRLVHEDWLELLATRSGARAAKEAKEAEEAAKREREADYRRGLDVIRVSMPDGSVKRLSDVTGVDIEAIGRAARLTEG